MDGAAQQGENLRYIQPAGIGGQIALQLGNAQGELRLEQLQQREVDARFLICAPQGEACLHARASQLHRDEQNRCQQGLGVIPPAIPFQESAGEIERVGTAFLHIMPRCQIDALQAAAQVVFGVRFFTVCGQQFVLAEHLFGQLLLHVAQQLRLGVAFAACQFGGERFWDGLDTESGVAGKFVFEAGYIGDAEADLPTAAHAGIEQVVAQ